MATRLDLDRELRDILISNGIEEHIYYQPPSSVSMKYPAIRYSRKKIDNRFADDVVYKQTCSYEIVVIDPNTDSVLVEAISKLPRCVHDRHYTSNNLNHDVFIINI